MTKVLLLSGFGLLATAAIGLEALARRGTSSLPTLADVAGTTLRRPAARVAVLAGWLWLGWHLFAR
jgi:hypothetical protein